jgi:hypothetical protein
MRGSTLATLQTRVRDLIPGKSTTGANTDSAITKALNRAREFMYTQYLWPHLRVKTELTFTGGKVALPSDYYSFATMRDSNYTDWKKVDPMKFELNINYGNCWTIEEESAISRTISTAVIATNVATITTATAHTYSAGDSITQSGVSSATFNETITIASVPSTTTYTYAKVSANESATGGTALRDTTDKIFVKPTSTTTLYLRYYKSLTDMSAATDQSEFFAHQEEAMVRGAEEFMALRDRDFKAIQIWEQNFRKRLNPVYQQSVDDDEEDQGLETAYDKENIFYTVNRTST